MLKIEIQAMERKLQHDKATYELGQALARLKDNRDFKRLIMVGFFQEEAIRLVHLKGAPESESPEKQVSIIRQMDAISSLNSYFNAVEKLASIAEKDIPDTEDHLNEARNEGE